MVESSQCLCGTKTLCVVVVPGVHLCRTCVEEMLQELEHHDAPATQRTRPSSAEWLFNMEGR